MIEARLSAPPTLARPNITARDSTVWLARGRGGRGKRRISDTLQRALDALDLKKPPLPAATIHRQAISLAERLG